MSTLINNWQKFMWDSSLLECNWISQLAIYFEGKEHLLSFQFLSCQWVNQMENNLISFTLIIVWVESQTAFSLFSLCSVNKLSWFFSFVYSINFFIHFSTLISFHLFQHLPFFVQFIPTLTNHTFGDVVTTNTLVGGQIWSLQVQ